MQNTLSFQTSSFLITSSFLRKQESSQTNSLDSCFRRNDEGNTRITECSVILSIARVVLISLISCLSSNVSAEAVIEANRLIAVGHASQSSQPDMAQVVFDIRQKGKELSTITQEVNGRVNQLMDALKRVGIQSTDINTDQYHIQPEYDWDNQPSQLIGYQVHQALRVQIRHIQQEQNNSLEAALNEATKIPVDGISQLRFLLSNNDKRHKQLTQQAIADAKQQAGWLAQQLQVNLGKIIGFREITEPTPQPRLQAMVAQSSGVNLPISQVAQKVSVEIIYAIQ